ncbi:GTP1/OBG, conserved site-containing protein [Artemisia annua]|uniref:GTP1/OBG, conserved site-containing protein n=1 Tax=Artemisia annua TaxID=35608 RepID=A0A2U1MVR2_ARTAN|nr:GTP1/OBG, conserved site-containing protein [Artemisia annua]
MGIIEKIKEIEAEMARTQKDKATEYHLGQLKAKIAKLRTQLLEPPKGSSGSGEGFEVTKYGHGRVALIGFPRVGKSTLLTMLTGTQSEAAAYEFTTLTCIPGIIHYNGTKIQLLDLPGIIEGASEGKGHGRQVIAVSKSSDIVLMVLDASKSEGHRQILTKELEAVGLRLNKKPPQIYFKKKKKLGIHNAELLFREDATVDDLIDVIEGNRKYMKCIYVYNKIDVVGIDDVDKLARQPNSIVISCNLKLNLDRLLAKMWEAMGLVRVYTKPQGQQPDFGDPVVLSTDRGGCSVEDFCNQIHRSLVKEVKYVLVWGSSARHSPQHCGLSHVLQDEDVVQIVKKRVCNTVMINTIDVCRIGIGICHDIRFPELAMLYQARGVELICYPSAFNITTGSMLWELEQQARQVHFRNSPHFIQPQTMHQCSGCLAKSENWLNVDGEFVGKLEHEEGVLIAEIDISAINHQRQCIPLQKHRRHDIYKLLEVGEQRPGNI